MNISVYVGHVTTCPTYMNAYYCVLLLYSSRIKVRVTVMIRFGVWLVSGYAHVFILSVAIVRDRMHSV